MPHQATLIARTIVVALATVVAAITPAPGAGAVTTTIPPGQAVLGSVALVPLDDRPYTYYAPQKLGGGAGFDVQTPPREVLGRHFVPGDGAAVGRWLRSAAHRADATVVALPMLAYGGLLNSRNSSVPQPQALQQLSAVKQVKRENPTKRLYAFDTIMRLTPEGPWRTQLRHWATLVDEVENLGMEGKRGQLEQLEAQIPQEVRDDYLATRQRNHALNLEMIQWAADGVFDYLVIGQDDASGTGLHRPEAIRLAERVAELGLQDRVVLYPGADVVASLLLARIAVEDAQVEPAVYVEYSRRHGDDWTAPYQNIRYAQLIKGYVRMVGGTIVADIDDADIVLMANTGGTGEVQPFADRVVRYLAEGRVVALGDDAIPGRTDMRVVALLDQHVKRGELVAYSGWNIGIPIAQSLSRHALLKRAEAGQLPPGSAAGQETAVHAFRVALLRVAAEDTAELTLSEWVQTNSYRSYVRNDTTAYASALGEPDPQHLRTYYAEVDQYAREHTLPYAEALFAEHFAGVPRPVGTLSGTALTITAQRVQEWNIYLPWLRTGEIAAEPEISFGGVGEAR